MAGTISRSCGKKGKAVGGHRGSDDKDSRRPSARPRRQPDIRFLLRKSQEVSQSSPRGSQTMRLKYASTWGRAGPSKTARREAVVDGRQEGKGGRGLLGSDVSCDKRQERLLNPKVST